MRLLNRATANVGGQSSKPGDRHTMRVLSLVTWPDNHYDGIVLYYRPRRWHLSSNKYKVGLIRVDAAPHVPLPAQDV